MCTSGRSRAVRTCLALTLKLHQPFLHAASRASFSRNCLSVFAITSMLTIPPFNWNPPAMVNKRKKLHPARPRRSRPPTTASGDDTLSSETTPHLTSPTLLSGASTSPSETSPHTGPATAAHGRHTAAQPGSRRHDGLGVVALILAISAFAAAGLRLWQIGGIPLALTLIPGAEFGNSPLLSIGAAIVAAMALVLGV